MHVNTERAYTSNMSSAVHETVCCIDMAANMQADHHNFTA